MNISLIAAFCLFIAGFLAFVVPLFISDIIKFRNNKRKNIELRIIKYTHNQGAKTYTVEEKVPTLFSNKWAELSTLHSFDAATKYLEGEEDRFYNRKEPTIEVVYNNYARIK